MTPLPKAFIFDLDGVIIDTAEYHYLAWKEIGNQLGITVDRAFNEQLKGISRMESLERILSLDPSLSPMSERDKERYATRKNELYQQWIQTIHPGKMLPGIQPLIEEIKRKNIKLALGSASKNAPAVLHKLQLTTSFDYIVDAAKVTKGKPDAETFLTAAEALFVPCAECIGIEDAQAGIEAINRANMFSVGVGERLMGCDYVVSHTEQLDFQTIISRYINGKSTL